MEGSLRSPRRSSCPDSILSFHATASKVLAGVRKGLPAKLSPGSDSAESVDVDKTPELPIGSKGHADVVKEASHYLSAIKVQSELRLETLGAAWWCCLAGLWC